MTPFHSLLGALAWVEMKATGPVSVLIAHKKSGVRLIDVFVWASDRNTNKYELTHAHISSRVRLWRSQADAV
jgi:hypothetical protein